MKKILLSVFILIACCGILPVSAQTNTAALDTKNGFRDARFETSFSSFKGMKLIRTEQGGDKKFYKRLTDPLTIGKYHLSSITYEFYKGKLSGVVIETPDFEHTQGVKRAFQSLYGSGEDSEETVDYWFWVSEKVWLSLDDSEYGGAGYFHMFSRVMEEYEKKEEAKKALKARGDL